MIDGVVTDKRYFLIFLQVLNEIIGLISDFLRLYVGSYVVKPRFKLSYGKVVVVLLCQKMSSWLDGVNAGFSDDCL